jgi:hypothetical protein
MNRRDALKIGLSLAAFPTLSPAQVKKLATADPAWKPSLFTGEQDATVVALTDLIIPATDTPGAKAANVNRYMDLLLHDGPAAERDRFLSGLKWLDEHSQKTHGAPFVKLAPEQQTAILQALDTSKSDELKSGAEFFRFVKGFSSQIYYNTEIGYKELNKKGVPAGFACTHDSH